MSVRTRSKPLRILKFGGTSVAGPRPIENVLEIIRANLKESNLGVVVSAMSGMTDKLAQAATHSKNGDHHSMVRIFDELRWRHEAVVRRLIRSAVDASSLAANIQEISAEAYGLCEHAISDGILTPQARDSILGLGERISARLVAAALAQSGVKSDAVDATELVVTDACHGGAKPLMDRTRERCQSRLGPLLMEGVIPVVTGFIGATPEGVATTLGRGGSDYSATILAGALGVDEVIIWTDVDGVLTADPRLVPDACLIDELSYSEAAKLAYFGAKVLHPKTLEPIARDGIPLWIRNTFAPEQPGTRVGRREAPRGSAPIAVAIRNDVALITVQMPEHFNLGTASSRVVTTAASIGADVLGMVQSSSENQICLVVSHITMPLLQHELARALGAENLVHIFANNNVALATMVGENLNAKPDIAGRALAVLKRAGVNTLGGCEIRSEHSLSILVEERDARAALIGIHQEFQLGFEAVSRPSSQAFSEHATMLKALEEP
jgi:aspartokinase/homoserine dehydrogenase 1